MSHRFSISPFTLAAVGILAGALCGCSLESKKTGHLGKADGHFASGEYEKAEIEYKNVLQLGEVNAHAVGRLGIIYFEQGRLARANGFLLKANELQPENFEVKLKLGFAYLMTGRATDARDAAIFILEREPQHVEAPILLAESVTQPRDVVDARVRLQKMTPSAQVVTALGLLDLRERKVKEAEIRLEQARQFAPKMVSAHSGLGQLYWLQKDLERADKSFAAAAELSPPRSSARIQYAQFNLQTGKLDVAKRLVDEMIRATPDFLPSYVLRSNIAVGEKQYDEAIGFLEKVLSREPYHPEALLLTAQAELTKGDKDKALATLQKAAAAFPQAPQIYYQLGNVHLARGDATQAANSFAEAVRLAPDFHPAVIALAQANVRQRNFTQAIASLKGFLQKNPTNAEAKLLLAETYSNQGNFEEALALYRQFGAPSAANAQIQFSIAMILAQQNKTSEARKALVKITEVAPDFLPAAELLVNLDLADKQYSTAQNRIESYISKNPKDATLYLILAKIHLQQSNIEKAEGALRKTIELQPDSPAAHQLLAQLYLSTNQVDKALASLQSTVAKNPKDVGSLMLVGVLHDQKKDFRAARESYEKILVIDPKAPAALNNLAYLLSEHFGELEKAQDLAQRARDLLPNHGEPTDTLGWILYKKRQYARALPLLEDSAGKLPDNALVQFHLGMAYYMMGEEKAAQSTLQRAITLSKDFSGIDEARESLSLLSLDVSKGDNPRATIAQALERRKDDPVALSHLAAIEEKEGNVGKALAAYEIGLKANPSNGHAAVNAIRLYRTQNEIGKALELAKATYKLVPSDGRIAHALGRMTYEAGERLSSINLLQEAARKRANDPEVLFDLAEASYSVGQVSTAETAFRDALEASPTFSRATQARLHLAMIGTAQNPAQAPASLDSIEKSIKADPANVPALIAKAALDEQKGDVKSAKEGYEKALARFPDFTPAKRRLAILYASHPEDDKKALDVATKAREAYPTDPDVAKAFGIILFRNGTHSRAASLLQESARQRATDAELMYYLGMSQRQLKDQPGSTRSLQRALELGLAGNLAAEARRALASTK